MRGGERDVQREREREKEREREREDRETGRERWMKGGGERGEGGQEIVTSKTYENCQSCVRVQKFKNSCCCSTADID
jgi:hypothetical protein